MRIDIETIPEDLLALGHEFLPGLSLLVTLGCIRFKSINTEFRKEKTLT
jgi:hypothetical protein